VGFDDVDAFATETSVGWTPKSIWPALRQAHGARVVALTSRGHLRSGVDLDDPFFAHRAYDKWVAYGQSKTANVKTVEQGAATTVWAATSPQLDGKSGVYCEDVDIASPTDKGAGAASGVASWAADRDTADRLWAVSERWTGAPFTL
jgi:hypothetical protein